jgi:hypothetical protein
MRLYRDLVEPELSEIRDSASRYDVNLNVEPDELLDWDAPYSKQPEKVKKLLDDVLTLNGVESYIPKDTGSKVYLGVADSADLRGSDIYRIITDQLGRMPDSASRELSASGVKGIKYLDGMSRSGQEGTRNYVIFDDSLIDTKRVNDKLTPSWMDQGARMQRAQDLGYDTSRPLYHYTDKLENETELSSLQPSPENVQTKLGRGIYTSPNPQYGDRYVRQGRDLSEGYNENARAIPVYARGKLATGDEYEAAYKAATDSLGIQRGVVDQQTKLKIRSDIQNKAQEILKEQGFDGVQFMDEVMIFDPKNVRSINAEFDPTRADSADLLSSRQSERQMSALRGIA